MATYATGVGGFFPELVPRYGLDPSTGQSYWPDAKTEYDRKVSQWMNYAYEEAAWERGQNPEVAQIQKYVQYIVGQQWPRQRPSYRSAPSDNRIWRLVWELVAILTDIRPTFEVKSTKTEYESHARMLNKVTRAWWLEADVDQSLALIIIYAILSTGFAKLGWNPEMRNGEGDFQVLPLGLHDLLTLKARNNLQSSQACIYRSLMPLSEFRRKFPLRGHLVRPDPTFSRFGTNEPTAPAHMPAMLFDFLSPQMKRMIGQPALMSSSVYPMALYREFWFRDWSVNPSNVPVTMGEPRTNWCYKVNPGQPLYPRGRLVVMGGNVILHDGPNPYWHGLYPFEALRMNIVPWQFIGLSELRPLIPLQDIINNVLAGILDMVKKAVNPGFYGPKNAFSESVWNSIDWSMPGFKVGYGQNVAQKPEFAPQPVLPAFVFNVIGLAAREMDQSSGIAAVSEAVRKKQVPSGETLEKIKEAQQTPIRLKGRNIEVFLRGLGRQHIHNVFQFYNVKRRMYLAGKDGVTFEDLDWDPGTCVPHGMRAEDHARNFSFMIHPGSMLNVNRMERTVMLMRMRMMRDLDRQTLFRELDLGIDVNEVEKNLEEEQRRQIQNQAVGTLLQQFGGALPLSTAGGSMPRQVRLPRV